MPIVCDTLDVGHRNIRRNVEIKDNRIFPTAKSDATNSSGLRVQCGRRPGPYWAVKPSAMAPSFTQVPLTGRLRSLNTIVSTGLSIEM